MSYQHAIATLLQALSDLESVRRQLRQPFAAKSTIEASIARLEHGLKLQSDVREYGAA